MRFLLKYLPEDLNFRFLRGILWIFLSALVSQGSVFINSIISARLLGKELFGQLAMIQITVGMVGGIAILAMGITGVKYVSEYRQTDVERMKSILGICWGISIISAILSTGCMVVFSSYICKQFLNSPQLVTILQIASIYVFFFTLNGLQQGILIGLESFSSLAKVSFIQGAVSIILNLILISAYGLYGGVASLVLTSFTSWFLHYLLLRKKLGSVIMNLKYSNLVRERKTIFTFIIPAALAGLVDGVSIWLSNATIVKLSEGYLELAIFNAANNFRLIILFFPALVSKVALPILNNLTGMHNKEGYQKLHRFNLVLTVGFTSVFACCLFIASPYLLLLYGEDFQNGSKVVGILAIAAVLEIIGVSMYQNIYAKGKLWWQFFISSQWALILLLVTYKLTPQWGALAMAAAYAIAWTSSCLFYWVVNRKMKRDDMEGEHSHAY